MQDEKDERRVATPNLTAAVLFVLSAAANFACLHTAPNVPAFYEVSSLQYFLARAASLLNWPILLAAAILVFVRPRLGYSVGLGTGLIALCWLAWSEWLLGPWDSWMFLNRNRTEPVWEFGFMYIKILAVALAVFATAVAILRLLPPGIRLRKAPLRQRTCPAAALGLAVLAAWFAHAVTPYEVPVCMKSSGPEVHILHVTKRGLNIQQTWVAAFRDGQAWVGHHRQSLFGYHFEGSAGRGFIPSELTAALAHSPDLLPRHTPPAKPLLRSWNGEAWYVIVDRRRLLVFTSENGAQPPESITAFVREAENIPLERVQKGALRDACLGFCSDPLSEMGYPEGRNEREALLLRSQ